MDLLWSEIYSRDIFLMTKYLFMFLSYTILLTLLCPGFTAKSAAIQVKSTKFVHNFMDTECKGLRNHWFHVFSKSNKCEYIPTISIVV